MVNFMYFILFFIYSFLGFILEIIAFSFSKGMFVNNHLLLLPFCPMYGFAAIFILLLTRKQKNIFLIFITSLLISVIIEYTTSYLLELIFNLRWWDYSFKRFDLHGRIALTNALQFGVLGVLLKYLNPYLVKFLKKFDYLILVIIILPLFLIDVSLSGYYTYKISNGEEVNSNFITNEIKRKVTNLK